MHYSPSSPNACAVCCNARRVLHCTACSLAHKLAQQYSVAGVDNGDAIIHLCGSIGRLDGDELVLCCGHNAIGKQAACMCGLQSSLCSRHRIMHECQQLHAIAHVPDEAHHYLLAGVNRVEHRTYAVPHQDIYDTLLSVRTSWSSYVAFF